MPKGGRRWCTLGFAAVIVLAAAAIGDFLYKRDNYDLCEVAEPHALQSLTGDQVFMDTRFCSPLAGDPGTVVVRFQRAGSSRQRIIFAYNPASPEPGKPNSQWDPDIFWPSPTKIIISIDRISQLQRQRNRDGEVHFVYRIGTVDYR